MTFRRQDQPYASEALHGGRQLGKCEEGKCGRGDVERHAWTRLREHKVKHALSSWRTYKPHGVSLPFVRAGSVVSERRAIAVTTNAQRRWAR